MIITEANELSYSGNPIVIKAESDQLPTFDGNYFQIEVRFNIASGKPSWRVGGEFTFGTLDASATFTYVNNVNEYSEDSWQFNTAGSASEFIEMFNAHPVVGRYWEAIQGGFYASVIIKAKFKGTRYNAFYVQDSTSELSSPLIFANLNLGTDSYFGESVNDYGVYCQVYQGEIEDYKNATPSEVANFTRVADLLTNFRASNEYEFDVSNVLKSYINYDLPDMSLNSSQLIGKPIGYFCRMGETYRVNDVYRQRFFDSNTSVAFAFLGAIDLKETNQVNEMEALTLASEKLFYKNQSQILYSFVKSQSVGNWSIKAKVYFYDGSFEVINLETIDLSLRPNGVYTIKIDTGSLQINAYESPKLYEAEYFEIYIEDDVPDVVINPISFLVMREEKHHKTIIFRNRFGVLDSISFVGVGENNINFKTRNYFKYYPLKPKTSDFNNSILDAEVIKTYRYSTGGLNETEFDNSIDLIKSNEHYELRDGELHAIVPVGVGYVKNDETELYTLDFEFEDTINENSL